MALSKSLANLPCTKTTTLGACSATYWCVSLTRLDQRSWILLSVDMQWIYIHICKQVDCPGNSKWAFLVLKLTWNTTRSLIKFFTVNLSALISRSAGFVGNVGVQFMLGILSIGQFQDFIWTTLVGFSSSRMIWTISIVLHWEVTYLMLKLCLETKLCFGW